MFIFYMLYIARSSISLRSHCFDTMRIPSIQWYNRNCSCIRRSTANCISHSIKYVYKLREKKRKNKMYERICKKFLIKNKRQDKKKNLIYLSIKNIK